MSTSGTSELESDNVIKKSAQTFLWEVAVLPKPFGGGSQNHTKTIPFRATHTHGIFLLGLFGLLIARNILLTHNHYNNALDHCRNTTFPLLLSHPFPGIYVSISCGISLPSHIDLVSDTHYQCCNRTIPPSKSLISWHIRKYFLWYFIAFSY